MSEHTKEPWAIGRDLSERTVRGSCTEIVAVIPSPATHGRGLIDVSERIANARRIVACVNACQGVETETLEKYGAEFPEVLADDMTDRERADKAEARLAEAERLLEELASSIERRWEHETQRKREANVSPRTEEALTAARAFLEAK